MKFLEKLGRHQASRLFQPRGMLSMNRPDHRQCCDHFKKLHKRSLRELSYSRMLDMGGAPSANSDQSLLRTVNASKNSRLQAVAFDFKTLINIDNGKKNADKNLNISTDKVPEENRELSPSATVDVDRVKQVAALLNVDLGSSPNGTPSDHVDGAPFVPSPPKDKKKPRIKDHNPGGNDIRAKYAAKLKGGLAGIELAKSQVEETLTTGDAAGHLSARKMAMMNGISNVPNGTNNAAKRWLPSLAATQLLTLLTHRSIRIVLLPSLNTKSTTTSTEEKDEPKMEDFKSQLKNVVIDKIISKFDNGSGDDAIEDALRKGILDELDVDANKVLLVSDRDQYLKVAREMGMSICRLQPKNARRGNITPHYAVQTIGEVQDVVNEINGISFNTVLNR